MAEPPPIPGPPDFVQVVPTTGGVIRCYTRFVKCPYPSDTIRDSYTTLCHNDTHVPPFAMCIITLKDNRIATLCTSWTTPLVTVVRNSYAHAQNCLRMLTVSKSEAEILNCLKHPLDVQGNGRFTTDSQGRIRTSDGDPSVKGALVVMASYSILLVHLSLNHVYRSPLFRMD